jgi:hypothetical protein
MTFLNPFVLFGLIASSIPIIIHLLNLRKLKKIEFSTLAFLKELQKNKIRKIKIKQILLLIIRTLILILLVLAFSRPVLKGYLNGFGSHAKTSTVIILDDSFSMNFIDEYGQIFKQAKYAVNNVIDLLEEGDDLSIIKFSDLSKPLIQSSSNFSGARKAIESLEPAYKHNLFSNALKSASNILSESKNFNKEIFYISDNQKSHFSLTEEEKKSALNIFDQNTRMFLINLGRKNARNISISGINIKNKIFEIDKPVVLEVSVRNNSDNDISDELISIYLEGKRINQKNVNISKNSSITTEITIVPKTSGFTKGYAEIEDDDLLQDNRGYFTFFVPDKIKILLAQSSLSDNQFLKLALNAANIKNDSLNTKLFNITETTGSSLASYNLQNYNLLILSNTPNFNTGDLNKIKIFLQSGGGLIVFPTDPFNITSFNSMMNELGLPGANGTIGSLTQTGKDQKSFFTFSRIDYDHPVFAGLFNKDKKNQNEIDSPEITFCLMLQNNGNSHPIITLSNNAPFLSEYKKNDQKALIFSVVPNLEWSNFPLKGIFLPVVIRSVFYLTNENESSKSIQVGDAATILFKTSEISSKEISLKDPFGQEEKIKPEQTPQGLSYNFYNNPFPGFYDFYTGSAILRSISVNINSSESDLKKITGSELDNFLKIYSLNDKFKEIQADANLTQVLQQSRYGIEIWKYLLFIALVLIFIEMLLAKDTKKQIADLKV